MELEGEATLHASRERAWAALHDAKLLKACVPGCEKLEWLDERTLEAGLTVRFAGLRRRYASRVHIRDPVPLQGYTLLFGSDAESASVRSRMRLSPAGNNTRLVYAVEARVDNSLARLGTGIVEKVARKMAGRFFARLNAALDEVGE